MIENTANEQPVSQEVIHIERRNGSEAAILTLNLDLNEFDYSEDELLKQVADRIHHRLRSSDIVVQLENNEFVVLLKDLCSPENAHTVTHKLVDVITEPFDGEQNSKVQIDATENMVKVEISFFPQKTTQQIE